MKLSLGLVEIPASSGSPASALATYRMAARRLGGYSLLEWLVRRSSECQSLDRLAVLAPSADEVRDYARLTPGNVPVVAGTGNDLLARCRSVADEFSARSVVRIRLDQPFTDPVLVDSLAAAANAAGPVDYVGFASRTCEAGHILRRVGLFAEWCRTTALQRADDEAVASADREHMTRYLVRNSERFRHVWLTAPAALDRDDLRLVLHRADDWDHAHEIVEALGHASFDWQSVVELLDLQPAMRGRMARLNSSAARDRGLATAAAQ